MKIIRYNLCTRVERTAEEGKPLWDDVLTEVSMPWSAVNEEIAKKEAYNGEYTIEDDGQPEQEKPEANESSVWEELDAAYQKGVDSV